MSVVFFFQAEDGIRDVAVTGVQTCALPICSGDTKIMNVGSLEATDGSGSFSVNGAAGSVRITDGSGELTIENVGGDVTVDDGSGEISVRNVSGSFTVESDGSGSIYATDVRGSVIVQNDGSGSIEVNKVGKDFRVESKGSGSIDYADVSGHIDIPERHRDRRRGDYGCSAAATRGTRCRPHGGRRWRDDRRRARGRHRGDNYPHRRCRNGAVRTLPLPRVARLLLRDVAFPS